MPSRRSVTSPADRGSTSTRAFRGIGLVEVLVAVLVLTVGVLAGASMQMRALASARASHHLAQAGLVVDDIADRMQGNPAGVAGGHYDGAAASASHPAVDCTSAGCTPARRAARDLHEWSARLHDVRGSGRHRPALPAGPAGEPPEATITRLDDGLYRISVRWNEPLAEGDGVREFSLDVRP